jgi:F5/8 type C domain
MKFLILSFCVVAAASAQNIVVDTAPSHVANTFSPALALGGAIDRLRGGDTKEENEKHTERLLTDPVLKEMLGAGWQTVTYRQNTELMIEAWHWNPNGTWSNPAKQEGYFTGSAEPKNERILHSWAYPLPHRGATMGDGNGWSRLTDGDLKSYWKSNPYLAKPYTGEDDSLHPQWIMVDLGAKTDINAIKIAWANPYATRYYVQFWTGEKEPFYDGINKGAWQTFPMGTVVDGKGGTPLLKLMNSKMPVRYLRIWMTQSSSTCDTHGAQDKRNCLGYAINELYIGTVSGSSDRPDGQFTDVVKHSPNRQQTITWPSSVDPWHAASDLDYGRGDQIGFDFFFTSGVTRGLPAMIPVAILYSTPEDAANEIAYLHKRNYPISASRWVKRPMGSECFPRTTPQCIFNSPTLSTSLCRKPVWAVPLSRERRAMSIPGPTPTAAFRSWAASSITSKLADICRISRSSPSSTIPAWAPASAATGIRSIWNRHS